LILQKRKSIIATGDLKQDKIELSAAECRFENSQRGQI
jgi:hypothetical protein